MTDLIKTVAAVQMDVVFGDIRANVDSVLDRIDQCGKLGIDLAVFPECALTGYCFDSREEAEPLGLAVDADVISEMAQACEAACISAVIGFIEVDGTGLFNAQVLLGKGGLLGSYRKVHLPGLGIDRFVDPGDRGFNIHTTAETNVGMAICYDSSFPETSRVLALQGADVIALSTNWPDAAKRTAEIVPSARSMENHLYFVAANRIGTERGFSFCGMSSITGPDGIVLAMTDTDDDLILTAEIDLAIARNKEIVRTPGKHVIDRFADRRPDCYGLINKSN